MQQEILFISCDRAIDGKTIDGGILVEVPNTSNSAIFGTPISSKSFEGIVDKVWLDKTNLYLMTVYRPPNFNSERHFCLEFKNCWLVMSYIDWVNRRIIKSYGCSLKFLKFCLIFFFVSRPTC